ncbi:hypothetical protein [Comamonas testosteroni]|uniref:hypothetical protein n=1 Tax=Comamonas testosteroni TaxID=285 RepID=UPI0012D337FB|nr:hypothetical protein [Comamonas testosteroni]
MTDTEMKPKAMFTIKRRTKPMQAVIVAYNEVTGRKGKVLASVSISEVFTNADLVAAAKQLLPQVTSYEVILPIGVEI